MHMKNLDCGGTTPLFTTGDMSLIQIQSVRRGGRTPKSRFPNENARDNPDKIHIVGRIFTL